MVVFYNIIDDISLLNAYVIYEELNTSWQVTQKTTKRKDFLRELGLSLAKLYTVERCVNPKYTSSSLLQGTQDNVTNLDLFKDIPVQRGRQMLHMLQ